MRSTNARQLRALRGVAASVLTTLLAAAAHTIGGGGAPAPIVAATSAILAAPIAVALVGRRSSPVRTTAAVAAAQVVFHVVFALFGTPGAVTYAPMDHAHMGAAAVGHVHAASAMAPDAGMVLTHVIAATLTIALLRRGERAVRAVLRGIRRLIPLVAFRSPAPARTLRPRVETRVVAIASPFAIALSRRGPPLLLH